MTVTLVNASLTSQVLYTNTITNPATIGQIVGAVDALTEDTGATRLCAMSAVDLQLDFTGPTGTAGFAEDPGCRSSVLTIDGRAGPQLDSALLSTIEPLLHINATIDQAGQATVAITP